MTHPVLHTRPLLPAWVPFVIGVWTVINADELLLAAMGVLVGLPCVAIAWPRSVDIGLEAIRVRPFLGIGGKAIPYTAIRLAAPEGKKTLVIRTMKNEALTLHAGLFRELPREALDRIWKAIAAGAEDGARGLERQALARSGRTTPAWRAGLRALAKPATYREPTVVSRERLWAIAENPGLELEVRGGAIVALAASALDESGRERLRQLDAATLHPTLHVLLEHAANGHGELDERVIDAALDALAR